MQALRSAQQQVAATAQEVRRDEQPLARRSEPSARQHHEHQSMLGTNGSVCGLGTRQTEVWTNVKRPFVV